MPKKSIVVKLCSECKYSKLDSIDSELYCHNPVVSQPPRPEGRGLG